MAPASERFLLRVVELAQTLPPRIAARLATPVGRRQLEPLWTAIASATGRELTEATFCELYAQTVACTSAALCLAGPTLNSTAVHHWLLAQSPPEWGPILAESQALLPADELPDELQAFARGCPDQDAVSHFFERFLARCDAKRRSRHGVYYTPRPLAAHIVRRIDDSLRDEFGLAAGLADLATWREITARQPALTQPQGADAESPFVTVLDPAVGSGVFLVEAIDCIHRRLLTTWAAAGDDDAELERRWNEYVPRHLLPRLFGLDIMLPACILAHLQIARKLAQTGFKFESPGRIQVHLLNTLSGPLTHEAWGDCESRERAAVARELCYARPCTVIVGNPPFSGISEESGPWITGLLHGQTPAGPRLANYFEVDGQPLGERKHWLQDDYVKFLRFAHWKIETAGAGAIGFVTNHGYLDNPTFRGLRQQLLRDFPHVSVIDLHGSGKKQERTPDGAFDENVFGIETGIALGLFRRPFPAARPDPESTGRPQLPDATEAPGRAPQPVADESGGTGEMSNRVAYLQPAHAVGLTDLWGAADDKLQHLAEANLPERAWTPRGPLYLFVAHDETRLAEYHRGLRLADLMPVNVTAPVTARDHFVVAFTKQELLDRLQEFRDLAIPDAEIRQRYFTRTRSRRHAAGDTRGWKLATARRKLAADPDWQRHIRTCWYRPFDKRYVYWADSMIDWPRREVLQHLQGQPNLALLARRQMLPAHPCNFFWITDTLALDGVIRSDNRGSEAIFPLYLFAELDGPRQCRANFAESFVRESCERLQLSWTPVGRGDLERTFGPEDLLHYAYAMLFSPDYRERYADLLRRDFPRLFVPLERNLFRVLGELGAQLIERHLLRNPQESSVRFQDAGAAPTAILHRGFPKYDGQRVQVTSHAWFEPVPRAVWEYRVGGHQVCKKWWHDRRGRSWSPEEIACYCHIVSAIQDTLGLSDRIDAAIADAGGWTQIVRSY